MTFSESISTCFKKYFVFQGRASRSEYWWFQLLVAPAYVMASFIDEGSPIFIISLTICVVSFIPAIAAGVRRLHDTNKSGFFLLVAVIPFIGSLIMLFLLIPEGTKGRNQYGDNPLKKSKKKK